MTKSEEWVNPRVLELNLGKWDEGDSIVYIANYNGLYIGFVLKKPGLPETVLAKAILDLEITKRMFSSVLSKKKVKIGDQDVTFYISVKRAEVSYALPK